MTATASGVAVPGPLSAKGRVWRIADADPNAVRRMMTVADLPEPAARVLVGRGVAPEEAEALLRPKLRALTPDPSTLIDLDLAAARLADAVERAETVGVLTDYDVDGATSAALLIRLLRALGVATALEAPDRIRDGYGPNIGALRRLRDGGATLVVCLDCGATAHEPLAAAAAEDIPVIVVDHHQADGPPPPALAVVNPNRPDDRSGMGALAAVGVTFLLGVGLLRALRGRGAFGEGRPEPDLKALLDLVALGTVADVVPLLGLNRAFVAQGLKVMAAGGNPGIAALMAAAAVDGPPDAATCGYTLGPRVNAGGRVGRADAGTRLLIAEDAEEAAALAALLDADN
ncbi:MAG: DHH family phosphoesterase, partial [Pseudomonadota bacterium]